MSIADRYAAFVTDHARLVVAVVLVATLLVGSGAANVEPGLTITSFSSDSPEAAKLEYIQQNFSVEGQNTTTAQVVVRDDDVLSRASLLESLRFQQALVANESVNATLAPQPFVGLSNIVAITAVREERANDGSPGGPPPTLAEQRAQLESMSAAEVDETVERVLAADDTGGTSPYSFLPTDYERGTSAEARLMLVFQDTSGADGIPESVSAAQLDIRAIASEELSPESFVFASGIVEADSGQATGESFAVISPVALLLIFGVLGVAYRDLVDILLGVVGIALVLVWMAGAMGWLGIGVTQILIAVPFLLIGLSIDYALHVVMRYREARADDPTATPREAMRRGLAGVVVAIGAATFTTAVGFLSNVVSPLDSISEFGLISAVGICAAFLVFGLLLPALKLGIEQLLGRVRTSRPPAAFGRDGVVGDALSLGGTAARRAPLVVLALAVLLAAGGGVAATDIDTTLDQTEFLPRDTPDWMGSLPEPFAPSQYDLRSNAVYLADEFDRSRGGGRAEFLVEGSVTDPGTLDRIAVGRERLAETDSAVVLADGTLQATGPLETISAVAAENETVADVVASADTDGDGVPDRNLTAVYDALYGANPELARATIHRADGEYRALRLSADLSGGVTGDVVLAESRAVATAMEGDGLTVTATGGPILTQLAQNSLLETLVEGFLITFVVILGFLTAIFRSRYGSWSLGAVVLFPVVAAQAWLLGTMYVAGLAFTTETAIITAIGIGIGVDYTIHIGERFVEEYDDAGGSAAALDRTVRGTGGALLASAATTAAGFGVLVLALVPSLRRFGFLTAVAIAFAFLASVLVLPSALTLWSRFAAESEPATAEDRGVPGADE